MSNIPLDALQAHASHKQAVIDAKEILGQAHNALNASTVAAQQALRAVVEESAGLPPAASLTYLLDISSQTGLPPQGPLVEAATTLEELTNGEKPRLAYLGGRVIELAGDDTVQAIKYTVAPQQLGVLATFVCHRANIERGKQTVEVPTGATLGCKKIIDLMDAEANNPSVGWERLKDLATDFEKIGEIPRRDAAQSRAIEAAVRSAWEYLRPMRTQGNFFGDCIVYLNYVCAEDPRLHALRERWAEIYVADCGQMKRMDAHTMQATTVLHYTDPEWKTKTPSQGQLPSTISCQTLSASIIRVCSLEFRNVREYGNS